MPTSSARLLLAQIDASAAEPMAAELGARGHHVTIAPTASTAAAHIERTAFDVIVVDASAASAMDLLGRITDEDLPVAVVALVPEQEKDAVLDALDRGAVAVVRTPPLAGELGSVVASAFRLARARRENASLHARLDPLEVPAFLTGDPKTRDLLHSIEQLATSELPVILHGESGTGRGLLARVLHRHSARAVGPIVACPLSRIPADLQEVALFGHERGERSGILASRPGLLEAAAGGVLLIEDVGALSPPAQEALLRTLETGAATRIGGRRPFRLDARLVCATTADLPSRVAEGRFRADLLERLSGTVLHLSPLRERTGDVILLARHFLERLSTPRTVTPRALDALAAWGWPGNVRELRAVVLRAADLAPGNTVDAEHLPPEVRSPDWRSVIRPGLTLADLEKEYIQTVLRQQGGHRGRTARALGIDPKTLYNKLGPERPRKKS